MVEYWGPKSATARGEDGRSGGGSGDDRSAQRRGGLAAGLFRIGQAARAGAGRAHDRRAAAGGAPGPAGRISARWPDSSGRARSRSAAPSWRSAGARPRPPSPAVTSSSPWSRCGCGPPAARVPCGCFGALGRPGRRRAHRAQPRLRRRGGRVRGATGRGGRRAARSTARWSRTVGLVQVALLAVARLSGDHGAAGPDRARPGGLMTVLVLVETVLLAVLTVLVAGLLRAYGDGAAPAAPTRRRRATPAAGRRPRRSRCSPRRTAKFGPAHDIAGTSLRGEVVSARTIGVEHDTVLLFLSSGCASCATFWSELAGPVPLPPRTRLLVVAAGRVGRQRHRTHRARAAGRRRAALVAGVARLRGARLAARRVRRRDERRRSAARAPASRCGRWPSCWPRPPATPAFVTGARRGEAVPRRRAGSGRRPRAARRRHPARRPAAVRRGPGPMSRRRRARAARRRCRPAGRRGCTCASGRTRRTEPAVAHRAPGRVRRRRGVAQSGPAPGELRAAGRARRLRLRRGRVDAARSTRSSRCSSSTARRPTGRCIAHRGLPRPARSRLRRRARCSGGCPVSSAGSSSARCRGGRSACTPCSAPASTPTGSSTRCERPSTGWR